MKLIVDTTADALYLTLDETAVTESVELAPGMIADYDARGLIVGLELLHLSRRSPGINVHQLLFETQGPHVPAKS
ncbi:MAG: hypothetical protein A2284_01570 [Deltaproteobacteria bacterium RIFOXYA12_FULL_61_11]|nr:MAG: hypothetical protein A2284_01570 [Deltaproteobacteria bacterium RIFOXYA12_FULL_61_11]